MLVTDEATAAPIADAELSLICGGDRVVASARTDASGAHEFRGDAKGATLVVRHHRYVTTEQSAAPRRPGEPVHVALAASAPLAGRVRLVSGQVPSVPVRVVALPLASPALTANRAQRATSGDPRAATAVTDADGAFRILGLRAGEEVVVLAAGLGLVQVTDTRGPVVARPGGQEVTIPVASAYVFDVRFRDPDGGRLRTSSRLVPCGTSWRGGHGALDTLAAGSPLLAWAQVAGTDAGADADPFRFFCAYAVNSEEERFGPFRVHAEVPGYRPVDCDTWALRADRRADPTQEIRLAQECDGFGTLRIRVEPPDDRLAQALDGVPLAGFPKALSLALHTETPRRRRFEIDLAEAAAGALVVDGVPAASYRAFLHVPFGGKSATAQEFAAEVLPDSTTELAVSPPPWSAIEVETESVDAPVGYSGPLLVTLRRAGTSQVCMWTFSGPPYRVVGIEPRRYEVQARGPAHSSDWHPVECAERATSRVVVLLARSRVAR